MTKITLALTAALLAGTTLTHAANAGGIRVGFGFPLGSFVAHSNQNYADEGSGYGRHCDRKTYARRSYQAEAAPVRRAKRHRKIAVAAAKQPQEPIVQTAKLESKLENNPATTTEIAKTISGTNTQPLTTASITPATTDTSKTEKVVTADKASTEGKAEPKKVTTAVKQVCRRYSATIAGLVDIPCNE